MGQQWGRLEVLRKSLACTLWLCAFWQFSGCARRCGSCCWRSCGQRVALQRSMGRLLGGGACAERLTTTTMNDVTGRHTLSRCGLFLLMVLWWGLTYCAPNSLELVQLFHAFGRDWTTFPKGVTHNFMVVWTESWVEVGFSLFDRFTSSYIPLASWPPSSSFSPIAPTWPTNGTSSNDH